MKFYVAQQETIVQWSVRTTEPRDERGEAMVSSRDSNRQKSATSSVQEQKKEVRRQYRARLEELDSSTQINDAVSSLNQRLVRLLKTQSGVWGAYQAIGHEPDLSAALREMTEIEWAFPRVEGEELGFYVPPESSSMSSGQWGLMEPDPMKSRRVSLPELKGFLIPGLVFDRQCQRMGRGRGYYDRTLSHLFKINLHPIKIGIALDRQISEENLPVDSFDMPMDWVLTESRCWHRERGSVSLDSLSERKSS